MFGDEKTNSKESLLIVLENFEQFLKEAIAFKENQLVQTESVLKGIKEQTTGIPLFVNTSPEEAKIYFRNGNYYPSDLEFIYVSHKDIIDVDGPYDIECFDYFVYKNLFKPE